MSWINDLQTPGIKFSISEYTADSVLSYDEMLALFQEVSLEGITSAEFSDLQSVYINSTSYFANSYVKTISHNVIYGHASNKIWTGGVKAASDTNVLGNMEAGTSAQNAKLLVDKWFLGLDLPIPDAGGDTAKGIVSGGVFSYSLSTGSFGLVEFDDVYQGLAGTCYLLAALGSIANTAPQYITNAIRDNGNGTYGVRFFQGGQEEWVTVNYSIPVYPNQGVVFASANAERSLAGENWVSLFEKAYAQLKGNSYSGIEGGLADPLTEITQLDYEVCYYPYHGPGLAYKQQMVDSLNQGSIGWLGSWGETYDSGNGKVNLVAGHAFMLLGYNADTDKFIIRNPWGPGNSWNVQFELSFDEFWNSEVQAYVALTSPSKDSIDYAYSISSNSESIQNAVSEGEAITFTITRSSTGTESTVYLSTLDGTAKGSDYNQFQKEAISFKSHESVKTIKVITLTDTHVEGSESFTLNLFKDRTSTTSDYSSIAFIKDVSNQDFDYTITSNALISADAVEEGSDITFTITRSGKGSPSTIYLNTSDRTASSGDYIGLNEAVINFAAYETSKTVTIKTVEDSITEDSEYFSLDLSKNPGSDNIDATAEGYIKDQYQPVFDYIVISSAPSPSNAVLEGGTVTFTITRSGSGVASTIFVETQTESAGSSDFVELERQAVTFAANEKIVTIDVKTNKDMWLEATQYFFLNVFAGATDTVPISYGVAFIEDDPYSGYKYTITNDSPSESPAAEGSVITFTITRNGSGTESTIYASTADGPAGTDD